LIYNKAALKKFLFLVIAAILNGARADGHQAKNRKKGGYNFNCPLLLYYKPN
jgi:hypothetical protein